MEMGGLMLRSHHLAIWQYTYKTDDDGL